MNIVLKELLNVIFVIALFLACIAGFLYYNSVSLKRYCTAGVIGQNYEQVNNDVSKNELYLHRVLTKDTNRAVINNHASPFFRMACFIELESGVVKVATFGAGD